MSETKPSGAFPSVTSGRSATFWYDAGDGDVPMADAGSAGANFGPLERVMADQRQIIADVTGETLSETPQIWALCSEVLEYCDQGMNVPDDTVVVLCDDNWGNVRRLHGEER